MKKSDVLSEKLKELEELENEKQEKWNELYIEYDKIVDNINTKILELFDFKNKWIKRCDPTFDITVYMRCDTVMKTTSLSGQRPIILLRGYGFNYIITK